MDDLKSSQIRYLRLRAQSLIPDISETPPAADQLLTSQCGFQAQELPAAILAFRPRRRSLSKADVEHARLETGAIVRSWAMRGTLHMLAAADLGWLLDLIGPVFVRKSRRRYQQLGLEEAFCVKAVAALPGILTRRVALTRRQLTDELTAKGFPTTGQATYHLLRRAALEGVICYGPDRDGQPAFVLLDEWAPQDERSIDRQAALTRLARRYLAAYGPATAVDLATWSGLSIKESRAGMAQIKNELLALQSGEASYWILNSQTTWLDDPYPGQVVNLLPGYDTYLLGYRSRALSVPPTYAREIHPGGGVLRPALMVDGCAAGTWHLKQNKRGIIIRVKPFKDLSMELIEAVEQEVQDLGRFLQEDAALHLETPIN